MVSSPHDFVIYWIKVLKGIEKVTKVIDVKNWRVDDSRVLRWIVSLIEGNSSVSSTESSIQNGKCGAQSCKCDVLKELMNIFTKSLIPLTVWRSAAHFGHTVSYYPKRYWEIQRHTGSYYPKKYWELLSKEILRAITQRDTGRSKDILRATTQRDIRRSEDILGATTQRDTRSYYPKRYWELFPKEILGVISQRNTFM
uniref:Uncharacterized protein n=1 Tax=Tanacetum cinerariifolium TaxID=118510 RepID=A0A6L2KVX9_TANCI|nr:hypothetical protein [Tanacetum cinerariifolium]